MISIVIITKNEEKNLEWCLRKLKWCNDIIVVDNYSSDSTVEIAKKYTDKIYQRKFDNFSNQRNFGISKTSNNWILSIDPDEEVTSELKQEIFEAIKTDKYVTYYMPFKHRFFGKWLKHGGWYPSYLKRLFRKDKAFWENDVHEILKVDGPVGYLKNPIIHYSHKDIFMFIRKMNNYTDIEAQTRIKKGLKDNASSMIFNSLKTFFNRYILQLGFLDGAHGFVVAVFLGFYVFVYRAKTWEGNYNES